MAHIEETRAVVEDGETFDGKIIPTTQTDLGRPVRIRDDASVLGSIYGETVETHPDSTIEGSVMASEAVEMNGGRIHGEVGTPGKVVAEDGHIDGTVTGQRVRLVECIVRGNVVGADVILEDCVVLGLATADRQLTIENSLCYTVRAQGEVSFSNASLILPQAILDDDVTFETPVSVVGLGPLDIDTDAGSHEDAQSESDADGSSQAFPQMAAADLYEQEGTTYLTLTPRVLNLERITDRLDELEQKLMVAIEDARGDEEAHMQVEQLLTRLEVDVTALSIGALSSENPPS